MKKILFLIFCLYAFDLTGQAVDSIAFDSAIAKVDSVTQVAKVDTAKSVGETLKEDLKPPSVGELISFGKIFWSIIFIVIGYLSIRFVSTVLESFAERSTNYRITIKGLVPIIKIMGWAFVLFIIIAGIFHPPISTVLAVTASVGIAIGFAAQDIIKNVFGGIMILFDRPFQVGDKVEIGSFYGEVVEIGLRSTRLVTPDDSLVSVPNAEVMNTSVSNSNAGEANCQVVAEIYLPITVDTAKIRQVAIEAAQVSKYIYLNKPIAVLFFNEVKQRRSYLKMRLKAYVADIRNEFAFKSDMTEMVMRELIKQKLIDPEDLK
ncbi:MAG TPA: mechanosensitive ion channel [Fulvivirga sp.]|nr:mechanosensitive ion channel [Fulvivirga sp.]